MAHKMMPLPPTQRDGSGRGGAGGAGVQGPASQEWRNHLGNTLYTSLVIIHSKYAGWSTYDYTAHGKALPSGCHAVRRDRVCLKQARPFPLPVAQQRQYSIARIQPPYQCRTRGRSAAEARAARRIACSAIVYSAFILESLIM